MKKNYKIFLIIGILIVAVSFLLFLEFKAQNNITVKNEEFHFTNKKLPSDLSKEKEPFSYDFSRSSLSEYWNKDISNWGIFYAVLVDNSVLESSANSGYIFIEKYTPIDFYPPNATGYKTIYLSGNKWIEFKNAASNWDKKYKFKEDRYSLFIIKENTSSINNTYSYTSQSNGSIWLGYNLNSIIFPLGYRDNNQRDGYSSKWLRRPEYAKSILTGTGLNIKDSFFDKYNLYQIITINKKNNPNQSVDLKVYDINRFASADNSGRFDGTLESVNKALEINGYEKIK